MIPRNFPIFPLLIMIAIGICVYWLYKNVELVEIELPVAQKDIARDNRLLAAARLLEQNGFEFNVAKDRSVFSDLNVNTTDVLWLPNLNELNSAEEVNQVFDWVESGGMLLTSPVYPAAFEESTASGELLDKIGIRALSENEIDRVLNSTTFNEHFNSDTEEYQIDLETSVAGQTSLSIIIDGLGNPYIRNTTNRGNGESVITDTPFIIHKRIGKGFVTVYTGTYLFFHNYNLNQYDHGYLLLWLTQPAKLKKLTIVSQPKEKPGLFQVLWNRFTVSILILAAVLIGFLRWASSRLGPVEHELPPIQNNLMAHLEARGEYWYRHNYTDKIVGNVQEAALDNLLKHRGLSHKDQMNSGQTMSQSDREASIKQASELLKCSPVTAERALYGKASKDHAILTTSRALQRINHRKPSKLKS